MTVKLFTDNPLTGVPRQTSCPLYHVPSFHFICWSTIFI